jgi:alpha-N-acetylglucosaminidase
MNIGKLLVSTIITFVAFSSFGLDNNIENEQIQAAKDVIGRILPDHVNQFKLELIAKDGDNDLFELSTRADKILIRGSSGVALCSGFKLSISTIIAIHHIILEPEQI